MRGLVRERKSIAVPLLIKAIMMVWPSRSHLRRVSASYVDGLRTEDWSSQASTIEEDSGL